MAGNRYIFDNAVTAETELRFAGLETTFDPSTIRYLTSVGVADGWACWEIGAGGGSIARWLADRVGPAGSVLATIPTMRPCSRSCWPVWGSPMSAERAGWFSARAARPLCAWSRLACARWVIR